MEQGYDPKERQRLEYINRKERYFTKYSTIEDKHELWQIANEIEKDLNFISSLNGATLISTHIITNRGCVELMSIWERQAQQEESGAE